MLTPQKTQKSPLVYPNDRPQAVTLVSEHIPNGVTDIVTPFLGGGSLELGLAKRKHRITAFTEYRLLYDFWECVMSDPKKIYQMVSEFYPMEDKRMFSVLQKKIYQPHDEYLRSALFYVLNHCSESGSTTGGSIDPGTPKFNQMRLNELAGFNPEIFELKLGKYTAAFDEGDFLVCSMPSYMKTGLAEAVVIPENPQINHKKFARLIKESDCRGWILLYQYHEDLLELYSDNEIILLREGYRPTTNIARASEVMIIGS